VDQQQAEKVARAQGFIAALDQSGGSTPKALRDYGIEDSAYSNDTEMFDLMHAMRTRIVTSPSFTGERILGAILFKQTMERSIDDVPSPQYLWERKNVVPFLKVDLGLADQADGAQVMKPIDGLDAMLEQASKLGVFGTKMRSVIHDADPAGVDAVLDQQFEYAATICDAGLVPIIEPEVSIKSPQKAEAETLLKAGIVSRLEAVSPDRPVMLKLTLPSEAGLYGDLTQDERVLRVVALSGGYDRAHACELLAQNPGVIASFSRALTEGLSAQQSDEEFDRALDASIEMIYKASIT
jgi:fructose-bisphosphate aldolase class I